MDARKLIEFFKKPAGKFLLFLAVVLLIMFGISSYREHSGNSGSFRKNTEKGKAPYQYDIKKVDLSYEKLSKGEPEETKSQPEVAPVEKPKTQKIEAKPEYKPPARAAEAPPILNIYTRPPEKNEVDLAKRFAPYGRLVECQLVITVNSAIAETPVVALVTKDVWHQGELVIPAGAEVHGRALNKPVRDRIMTEREWVVVWRTRNDDNGKELRLKGLALTKEALLTDGSWHINDGSAGIRGEIIKSSEMTEIMAYAAEFLATFTDNLVQESVTITDWGQTTTNSGSVKDAVNMGVSAAVRKYADNLMEELKSAGYYVSCAGGTEFYLYVTDVINMNEAEMAGTLIKEIKKK